MGWIALAVREEHYDGYNESGKKPLVRVAYIPDGAQDLAAGRLRPMAVRLDMIRTSHLEQEKKMGLAEQMEAALNDQVTCELSASLAYLQMAVHLERDGRPGMGSWMRHQSEEEAEHARMFIEFLLERGGRVEIQAIAAPMSKFDDPAHVFEEALHHEQVVSERIRDLYRLAIEIDDVDSLPFLQGFLTEQIEEEASVGGIWERIQRLEGSEVGLALIDHELGSRE